MYETDFLLRTHYIIVMFADASGFLEISLLEILIPNHKPPVYLMLACRDAVCPVDQTYSY